MTLKASKRTAAPNLELQKDLKKRFCEDVDLQDEVYVNALIRMFDQALKTINALPESDRPVWFARLDVVRGASHDFGYGVGDDMGELCARYGIYGGAR